MSPRIIPFVASLLLATALPAEARSPDTTRSLMDHSVKRELPWADWGVLGLWFDRSPERPPGRLEFGPVGLSTVRNHLRGGDADRALRSAEALAGRKKWSAEQEGAWLISGLLRRERGETNLASQSFSMVRSTKGPLGWIGAFFEAEQDLHRGKPAVAIKECNDFLEKHAHSGFQDRCKLVVARAQARLGQSASARDSAAKYDEEHDAAPIGEQIELDLVRWEMRNAPAKAAAHLQELWLDHGTPLVGRMAEEWLVELGEKGVRGAGVPTDSSALMRRAVALRSAGRADDAWKLFETLQERSTSDKYLATWVDKELESFAWRARKWDILEARLKADYAKKPDGDKAFDLYKVLCRSSRYSEAGDLGLDAIKRHANSREWRRNEEEVARTMMLAGRYSDARDLWDVLHERGGFNGRRGAFYAAFSAMKSGDLADALARFDALITENKAWQVESHYWRAKVHAALGHTVEAAQDRAAVAEIEPWGWYDVLIKQQTDGQPAAVSREGRWVDPLLPPPLAPQALALGEVPVARPVRAAQADAVPGLGLLTWPFPVAPPPPRVAESPLLAADPSLPPAFWPSARFMDDEKVRKNAKKLVEQAAVAWPELPGLFALADAGAYDLSGPMFSAFWEDFREALQKRSHPGHTVAKAVTLESEDWTGLFYLVRDHHHTARFTVGMDHHIEDDAGKKEALRLQYPLAQDRHVWTWARRNDVDPFLVLGLMRQESTYNAVALSRVGARGAMQIMPRTGHLLADRERDLDYTSADLEDPTVAVDMGIHYLGLLLDRFDGVFPMAVASYNAGPHNVSPWLIGLGPDVAIDEFVEQIPYQETRGYVKRVTANYALYTALYAPPDHKVVVPATPKGNHPEVVDF